MNSFSKIVSILMAVLLLFLFPLLYLAQKQDAIIQTYVTTETVMFADAIKNSGKVTADEYTQYIKNLDYTNNIYDIQIEHAHEVINPVYDDTNVFMNSFSSNYFCTYEEDIKKEIFEGTGIYTFTQGDYITIKVKNRTKTMASKLLQLIYQTEIPKEQIQVIYGGIIRDETY